MVDLYLFLQVVDQETVLVTVEVDVLQHVLLADLKEQLQQLHVRTSDLAFICNVHVCHRQFHL